MADEAVIPSDEEITRALGVIAARDAAIAAQGFTEMQGFVDSGVFQEMLTKARAYQGNTAFSEFKGYFDAIVAGCNGIEVTLNLKQSPAPIAQEA